MLQAGPLQRAADMVRDADRIALFLHESPDGDTIGCALALNRALRSAGKSTCVVSPDPVPDVFHYLPGVDEVLDRLPPHDLDLLLISDCGELTRIAEVYARDRERFSQIPILNIDHHETNSRFGSLNWIDKSAAAVCELGYALVCELGIPIDPGTAVCLMTGLVTDTHSFQHANTTPRTLEVAAALRAAGADVECISYNLFRRRTFAGAVLWGRVLAGAQRDSARRVVWGFLRGNDREELGAVTADAEGLVDFLTGVIDTDITVLLKEGGDGLIHASLRSSARVNVADLAVQFGGGGHARAAGCEFDTTIEVAQERLSTAIDGLLARS